MFLASSSFSCLFSCFHSVGSRISKQLGICVCSFRMRIGRARRNHRDNGNSFGIDNNSPKLSFRFIFIVGIFVVIFGQIPSQLSLHRTVTRRPSMVWMIVCTRYRPCHGFVHCAKPPAGNLSHSYLPRLLIIAARKMISKTIPTFRNRKLMQCQTGDTMR